MVQLVRVVPVVQVSWWSAFMIGRQFGPGGQGCLGGQGGPSDQVCQCIYGLHGLNNQIIEKT